VSRSVDIQLESELKKLIVEALVLEDVEVDEIDPEAPLFNEGLGLDSIDALELAIAIQRRFGVKLTADDEANRNIFSSLRSLAQHIGANRNMAVQS
jgi:acyl carrier protein